MTRRAILLGSILSLAIGLILPVTEFLIQGTRLGLSSATPAAFFLLFVILIGPQFLIKCLKPEWALRRGELLVIFAMMMVATVIPTRGFGGPFFSMITGATYYASEENEWAKLIQPHLSDNVVIKDLKAVRQMYEGLEGAPIPWDAWMRPLGWWSLFVLCMAAMVISAMLLLRKTWIERERLVFPVAQVALAMVEEDRRGEPCVRPRSRLNPLFHSSLFWIGFLIPMTLESLTVLNRYFPGVPVFRLQWAIRHDISWVPQVPVRINFLMFGFAFFIQAQLSFSLWFFYLLSLPAHWMYGTMPEFVFTQFPGTSAIGPRGLGMIAMMRPFMYEQDANAVPIQIEGLRIAERGAVRASHFAWAIILAIPLIMLSYFWASAHIGYRFGMGAKIPPDMLFVCRQGSDKLDGWLRTPGGPNWSGTASIGIGAAIAVALMNLKLRFPLFPLHPMAFPLAFSWSIDAILPAIVITWTVKAALLRYGGLRAHQRALPFFLGLIVGDATTALCWTAISHTLRSLGQ